MIIFLNQRENTMQQFDFIGAGEHATFNILKHLTNLHYKSLKEFGSNGIYKQVPLEWIIHKHDYNLLSDAHKKGSIDLFIILNQKRIAIRVQGNGHGKGLKGLGKVRHDTVQEQLIKKYCSLVDIQIRECPNIFKERVTEQAKEEIISSFKTAGVMITVC